MVIYSFSFFNALAFDWFSVSNKTKKRAHLQAESKGTEYLYTCMLFSDTNNSYHKKSNSLQAYRVIKMVIAELLPHYGGHFIWDEV